MQSGEDEAMFVTEIFRRACPLKMLKHMVKHFSFLKIFLFVGELLREYY